MNEIFSRAEEYLQEQEAIWEEFLSCLASVVIGVVCFPLVKKAIEKSYDSVEAALLGSEDI